MKMSTMNKEEFILDLIQGTARERVCYETRLDEISIDMDELIFVLEGRFGVLYDNVTELQTVGDVVEYFLEMN